MLKEVISPGIYFYIDEKTNLPHKLEVTPELTKYWYDQGKAMLNAGLTIPIPYEHDFSAHPMTPKDKLLNNAGWVKDYKLIDNRLFSEVDIQDKEVVKKLPTTIRYTSPWINSFTDGNGKKWNNVISHLALTTRPRITKQEPFKGLDIAAALSLATPVFTTGAEPDGKGLDLRNLPQEGFSLSKANRLFVGKNTQILQPRYPIAFSLTTGIALGDFPPSKDKNKGKKPPMKGGGDKPPPNNGNDDFGGDLPDSEKEGPPRDNDPTNDDTIDLPPLGDKAGDVSMEEVLCDLLRALGVDCQHDGDEQQFKRNLYAAAMKKVHELTSKGMNKEEQPKPGAVNQGKPSSPNQQTNPLLQQEQQPMYMGISTMSDKVSLSLEDINKITDPTMRTIALSMFSENAKLRADMEDSRKISESLRAAKLKEANDLRTQKINLLGKISPNIKSELDTMVALPNMALSMGEGGTIVDPMAQTISMLEKSLVNIPKLLTTDSKLLSVQPQPKDMDTLSEEEENRIAEDQARRMGAMPERQKA